MSIIALFVAGCQSLLLLIGYCCHVLYLFVDVGVCCCYCCRLLLVVCCCLVSLSCVDVCCLFMCVLLSLVLLLLCGVLC